MSRENHPSPKAPIDLLIDQAVEQSARRFEGSTVPGANPQIFKEVAKSRIEAVVDVIRIRSRLIAEAMHDSKNRVTEAFEPLENHPRVAEAKGRLEGRIIGAEERLQEEAKATAARLFARAGVDDVLALKLTDELFKQEEKIVRLPKR